MAVLNLLEEIRAGVGTSKTKGLSLDIIRSFLAKDPHLGKAIEAANDNFRALKVEFGNLLGLSEEDLIKLLQKDFLNFYAVDTVNPYVPLAAKGPWLITLHGAVLHDSGGYGMLGFGHGPEQVLKAIALDTVMANVMSASFTHLKFADRLNREIGHTFAKGRPRPFDKYVCLNSGSEAVTLGLRLSDINAKRQTDEGGRYHGRKTKFLALKGAFHGRTDRPAQASDSSGKYSKVLASFKEPHLVAVTPNDINDLQAVFGRAAADKVFYECLLLEPVMGEGDPGKAMTPEFYKAARQLCTEHGTLLLIDSIQAGFRAQGCLSIVDYPGFEGLDAPDMETYSKAINAGQFPLSVLALRAPVAALYLTGIYGNTMTSNPRALEVAVTVLDSISPALRQNIRDRGRDFVERFQGLAKEFPKAVVGVQGTGLLVSLSLNHKGYRVVGHGSIEEALRFNGIGVIHGGKNALRFTPHFNISIAEVDLIIAEIRKALAAGPVYGDLEA